MKRQGRMPGFLIQNGRSTILAGVLSFFGFCVVANAETVRLSKITRGVEVAIQRGYSVAESSCIMAVVEEIDTYGGPAAMREFRLSFDDAPLKIFSKTITHTCDNGIHRMVEGGQVVILQRYNEAGEPTMIEQ